MPVSYTHLDVYKRQLVGRYPANCLMERIPIDNRNSLIIIPCGIIMPSGINLSFERLSQCLSLIHILVLVRDTEDF